MRKWLYRHPVVPIAIGVIIGVEAVLWLLLATASQEVSGSDGSSRTVDSGEPVLAVLGLVMIVALEVLWIRHVRNNRVR